MSISAWLFGAFFATAIFLGHRRLNRDAIAEIERIFDASQREKIDRAYAEILELRGQLDRLRVPAEEAYVFIAEHGKCERNPYALLADLRAALEGTPGREG